VFRLIGVVLSLAGFVDCRPAAAEDEYAVDSTKSEFVVQLFKAGVGAALAHDHVVRATQYTGRIRGAMDHPSSATIIIEVHAASLEVDEPKIRQKYHLSTMLSEQERKEIKTTMASPQQLAIAQYPTLLFKSTQIERQPDGDFTVNGELTIRGVTHSIKFPARVEVRDGALHAQGSVRFRQSSFGYEPYSALLGAIRNQDEAMLHFDVMATPLDSGRASQANESERSGR
jgi:polyisoprenoid-binding protein YceI